MLTLCDMADVGPYADLVFGEVKDTIWNHVDRLWQRALDEPDGKSELTPKRTGGFGAKEPDPWADDGDGYSDEPPF
jgi:hypothetical protein